MKKGLGQRYKARIDHLFLPVSLVLILMIFWLRGQTMLEFDLVILGSLIYISLALLHHFFERSLTTAIIIEYILMAVLVLSISAGFLL